MKTANWLVWAVAGALGARVLVASLGKRCRYCLEEDERERKLAEVGEE